MLKCNQSPGDILLLHAAIREVRKAYGDRFRFSPDTPWNDLFLNSPYVCNAEHLFDPVIFETGQDWTFINQRSDHLIQEFTRSLIGNMNTHLHLDLKVPYITEFRAAMFMSEEEKNKSVVDIVGDDLPYWIIDGGFKATDYNTKRWPTENYQAVVDGLLGKVRFVQMGREKEGDPDRHPPLKNVVNCIGKTENRRDLVRLFYRSSGVVTPISFPMHLCSSLPMATGPQRLRPCVVIAGGRESTAMIQYPGHTIMSMIGKIDCALMGACLKVHVEDRQDSYKGPSQERCLRPQDGVAACMRMITPDKVIRAVEDYLTPPEAKRICVLSIADDNMKLLRECTFPNKQAYCDKHGYTFIGKTDVFRMEKDKEPRNGSWAKLPFVLELMSEFTHIFCIDADAVITNMDVKIESLIDDDHNFWVCNDQNGRNCGSMIVKSCEETWRFLRDAWDRHNDSGVWEQQAIGDLLRENPHRISEKVLDQRAMNSYPCNWEKGDFVLHCPRDNRWADRLLHLRRAIA